MAPLLVGLLRTHLHSGKHPCKPQQQLLRYAVTTNTNASSTEKLCQNKTLLFPLSFLCNLGPTPLVSAERTPTQNETVVLVNTPFDENSVHHQSIINHHHQWSAILLQFTEPNNIMTVKSLLLNPSTVYARTETL